MRLLRTSTVRRLGSLIALVGLTWLFAPSAVAGGPTSVLITSPESGETASLYVSDAQYEPLAKQLGGEGMGELPEGQKKRPAALDSAEGSRQINVTWMVHDVYPWRVDRVYPSADPSTVWIHTSTDTQGMEAGVWHRAKQPAALRALLTKIGVMGEKNGGGVAVPPQEETAGAAAAADTPVEDQERPAASGASAGASDGWWWAIPALGAGVALGLVLRPLVGRLPRPPFGRGGNRPEAGPRGQLLDV